MAGLNDITNRMAHMLSWACGYGCVSVFPSPHNSLASTHNGGKLVTTNWSEYYALGESAGTSSCWRLMWESLPTEHVRKQRLLTWDVPSRAYMDSWLRAGSRDSLSVLELYFPKRWFWGDLDAVFETARFQGPQAPPRGTQIEWPASSQTVLEAAQRTVKSLFGKGDVPYMGVHLRRGDQLSAYKQGCADVPSVVWNVQHQKRQSKCPGVDRIFVMTDETDPSYLLELQTALAVFFGIAVRLEQARKRPLLRPCLAVRSAP